MAAINRLLGVGIAQHLTRREGQTEFTPWHSKGFWFVQPTAREFPFYASCSPLEGSTNILPACRGTKVLTEALRIHSVVSHGKVARDIS